MDRASALDRYGYVSNNYHPQAVPIASQHYKTAHIAASQGAPYYSRGGGGVVQQPPPVIGQFGQQQEPIMRQPEYHRRQMRAEMFSHEGRPWTTGILGCMEDCDSCTSFIYAISFLYVISSFQRSSAENTSPIFQGVASLPLSLLFMDIGLRQGHDGEAVPSLFPALCSGEVRVHTVSFTSFQPCSETTTRG